MSTFIALEMEEIAPNLAWTNPECTRLDSQVLAEMFFETFEFIPLFPTEDTTVSHHSKSNSRVYIFDLPNEDLLKNQLGVGFVGCRRTNYSLETGIQAETADLKMIEQMAKNKSVWAYVSREISEGVWANLVLFNSDKVEFPPEMNSVHREAATQIAPDFYSWIRISRMIFSLDEESGILTFPIRTRYFSYASDKSIWRAERKFH